MYFDPGSPIENASFALVIISLALSLGNSVFAVLGLRHADGGARKSVAWIRAAVITTSIYLTFTMAFKIVIRSYSGLNHYEMTKVRGHVSSFQVLFGNAASTMVLMALFEVVYWLRRSTAKQPRTIAWSLLTIAQILYIIPFVVANVVLAEPYGGTIQSMRAIIICEFLTALVLLISAVTFLVYLFKARTGNMIGKIRLTLISATLLTLAQHLYSIIVQGIYMLPLLDLDSGFRGSPRYLEVIDAILLACIPAAVGSLLVALKPALMNKNSAYNGGEAPTSEERL